MVRRTYHYDEKLGRMVEGPGPSRTDGSGDGWRFSDRAYSGTPFKAPDGTVINSKAKHREYMKRTGLTTADDFTQTWAKKAEERAAFYENRDYDKKARREAVERAIYKVTGG
jgi:hypothetical protein